MTELLVGTRKGLFVYRRRGGTWHVDAHAFAGDPVSMVLADPRDGATYAALALGHFGCKLFAARPGDLRFEEIPTPAYPKKPEAITSSLPWTLELIWSLAAGGRDQPGRLWCGTIPGGLFKSDDHGRSWQLVEDLWRACRDTEWWGAGYDWPGIHSISIDPRDSATVTVGVSVGGVWRTSDDGGTWQNIGEGLRADYVPPEQRAAPVQQDPHRLVQCRGAPDTFWMQHHNGIWVSDDGGYHWREIEHAGPSTFGFAVAVAADDPQTAWFVPADTDERRMPVDGRVVVTRTRDGGASFDTLCDGLPQHNAWDLVYRHGLAVRDTALALGSTTGGLWFSDDGGDHFETISTHLPPIYCVSFRE